jgi:hypothetical protein
LKSYLWLDAEHASDVPQRLSTNVNPPLALLPTRCARNRSTRGLDLPGAMQLASPASHLRSAQIRQRSNPILPSRPTTQRRQDDPVMPCG